MACGKWSSDVQKACELLGYLGVSLKGCSCHFPPTHQFLFDFASIVALNICRASHVPSWTRCKDGFCAEVTFSPHSQLYI